MRPFTMNTLRPFTMLFVCLIGVASIGAPAAAVAAPGTGGVGGNDATAQHGGAAGNGDDSTGGAIADGVSEAASRLLETIQSIPMSTHGVVIALFVGGLVLAVFGKNSLRMGFALLGLLVGVQLSLLLPAAFGFAPSAVVASLVGAVLGLLVGLLAYKFTIMLTLGLAGAVLAPMAVAAGLYINDPALSTPSEQQSTESAGDADAADFEDASEPPTPDTSALNRAKSLLSGRMGAAAGEEAKRRADEELGADFSDRLEDGAATLARFIGQLGEKLEPYWTRMTVQQRLAVVGSSLLGLVLGMSFGAFLPDKGAALVTAFAGTAVSLPSGLWLYTAFDLPWAQALPSSPFVWVIVWFVVSMGFLFVRIGPGAKRGSTRRSGRRRGDDGSDDDETD